MAKKKLNKNLYQDISSGIWYFQKKVRGIEKPYKFSLETTSVVEARRKRDEYLLDIAVNGKITEREVPEAISVGDGDKLFGEMAITWAQIKEPNLSKSTMTGYRKVMNAHILPRFGNRPVSSITSLEIEQFISQLKCSGKRKINILTPFRDIFKFSKKHKFIDENPMDEVDAIKKNPKDKTPLNLDEINLFLKTVPAFYKPLFMFLFFTGVRFGEAAALKWKRVNWKDGSVYIRKTLVAGEYKDPKTKRSIRHVKLPQVGIEALKLQKEQTFGKSDFVFLNMLGRNIHPHSINCHVFKPTLKKAGLPMDRSCKDTRSSYITNAIDQNERIGFVQNQVGHETTKMIVEHYYKHLPAPDDGQKLDSALSELVLDGK